MSRNRLWELAIRIWGGMAGLRSDLDSREIEWSPPEGAIRRVDGGAEIVLGTVAGFELDGSAGSSPLV